MHAALLLAGMSTISLLAQTREVKIEELDRKLTEARQAAAALQKTIDSLGDELARLRNENTTPFVAAVKVASNDLRDPFRSQIIGEELGGDEKDNAVTARPELRPPVQLRFVEVGSRAVPAHKQRAAWMLDHRWLPRQQIDVIDRPAQHQFHWIGLLWPSREGSDEKRLQTLRLWREFQLP